MNALLKTTRPVTIVRTIDDIVAIERHPYDELVTAYNIYDLFRATAQHVGHQKALTVLGAGDPPAVGLSLTHRQLLAEITRAANMFRALGLAPGKGCAAFLTPTLPFLPPLLLGAQVAGTASSLNYLLSQDAIFDLLNAQKAEVLVIPAPELDEMCWSKAQGVFDHVPTVRRVVVIGGKTRSRFIGLDDALRGCDDQALSFTPSADRATVCALFHTGGTTGRPKLVQLTHGNQIHAAFGFAQVFGYDEQDVVVNGFPFFHVGGTMTTGLSVLAAGGHVIVPSPYALRPAAVIAGYWRIVERFGATVVSGVPTSIAALTNAWTGGVDVSSVRMAVTGGAVLPRAVGQRFETTTGIRLFETYGMTETAAAIAFNPGRGTPVAGSVGFRAPYSEIRIVRLNTDNPGVCGPNESGMVQVRGPQVFPGYVDPTQNQGVLTADGWLMTGDIGYLTEESRLVLTGREKDLIVRSGHNIDPAAIEDVANQFDGVQISAAVGMPDQYAGEVPALFVVPAPGARLDIAALRAYLDQAVHEPPARPRSILVIDALPVTAVGKVFKPALRDMAVKEKVRQEVERLCGPGASADVELRRNDRGETVVDVRVAGASAETVASLAEALRPLPQIYQVRSVSTEGVDELVTLQVQDRIAIITLNRPGSMNALSRAVMRALEAKVTALADVPDVRVVVLTGSGRAFSAGGDLIEFGDALATDPNDLLRDLRYNQDVLQLIEDLPVPVIGAVNGVAVAGGLELLLCCDIILAAEGVKLGDGHVRYGVIPAGGATVRLLERLAPARAAQLFYTGSLVDATTLRDWGLINEVVAPERLTARAMEIAQEISARSPEAIRHIKALTGRAARPLARAERLRAELDHFAAHVRGSDLAKGLAAFKAKQVIRY